MNNQYTVNFVLDYLERKLNDGIPIDLSALLDMEFPDREDEDRLYIINYLTDRGYSIIERRPRFGCRHENRFWPMGYVLVVCPAGWNRLNLDEHECWYDTF